jgi:putative transposase
MKKYKGISLRLQNWDYRWSATYFVTFNTKDRVRYFGDITNGKMKLSQIGVIADILWYEIKNHAKNVELGAFVVMPDHIHGIISIENQPIKETKSTSENRSETIKTKGQERFQNPGKNSLSTIIGSYKSAVTKHARRLGYEFQWQTSFHDKIIRDQKAYDDITRYIQNNPKQWKK